MLKRIILNRATAFTHNIQLNFRSRIVAITALSTMRKRARNDVNGAGEVASATEERAALSFLHDRAPYAGVYSGLPNRGERLDVRY